MSTPLKLEFLGLPQLSLQGRSIATDRRKAIALLAYLAVNDVSRPHQKYSRESLSTLLWPDYDQAKAFSNLRRTIWEVHQALGEDWLIAERESVQLNPDADIDLDVARFLDFIAQGRQQEDVALGIPPLSDAVKLYRNHFLTGFSLKDAYPFNEWAFAESEELRHKLAEALTMLVESHRALKQADMAIPYARRLISLDPLNESSHRQLMEVFLQAGQHSAALKQYQTCEQILRKELNLDPQPETRALYKKIRKGEIKPVQVEEQIEIITPKHNLPLQLSTFIGREREIDEIVNLLAKHRLVTLAGAGGIGKTRVALQVGQKLLKDCPDGIWFVALDSLSEPALVSQTVASVFDIRESHDRPIIEILTNVLHQKTALLILDNCEHLLEACTQLIATLLQNCLNLKILATSRQILNMPGEAVYYLPSLSMPEDHGPLEKLGGYESIQLFTQRATLVSSSFQLTKENAQIITDICRRVDGIPLAIELAAAYINILSAEEILKQLNESFALLASDSQMALPRHQTMHASLDWSWGLLSAAEQTFLRQLSAFAGGWTLKSAHEVCDGDRLTLTRTLVKKSLIVVNQETGRETRYHFHEIVRQYAREKLIEAGGQDEICARHLQYFLDLSKQAELGLKGPMQIEWHAHLQEERENIRAALEWANDTNVEAGLFLSARLSRLWENIDLREGNHWLSTFLQKAESDSYPIARAKALYAHAEILTFLQQVDAARSAVSTCLELFRACGDQQGEIDGLLLLSVEISDPQEKTQLIQQAIKLSQSIEDPFRQADALWQLGWNTPNEKKFFYWEKAIALFRKAGDPAALLGTLSVMGNFLALNGDVESAQRYLDEASTLIQERSATEAKINFFYAYGRLALIRGNFETARAYLQECLDICIQSAYQQSYLWTHTHLGFLALREGKIIEARTILEETVKGFYKDQSVIGVAFVLEGIAALSVVIEKHSLAARLIGWTDVTREKLGDPRLFIEQSDVDNIIAACLVKMDEAAFSNAYDQGQKMSLDEAVAYALEVKA